MNAGVLLPISLPINSISFVELRVFRSFCSEFWVACSVLLGADFAASVFFFISRLVMPSSEESSSVAGSSLTRGASQASDGPSYDWVDPTVLRIPSKIKSSDKLDQFLSTHKKFLTPDCPADALYVDICDMTDRVCHGRENAPHDFFFVYSTLFSHLHVSLPFDDFTVSILRILNVAPTQLHPNSWAILQAFRVICQIFGLMPTAESFLYYYNTYLSTQ